MSRRALVVLVAALVASRTVTAQAARFPDTWAGKWSGTLVTITPPDSVRNRIPVTLEITREASGSAYSWKTIFNADTVRGLRPYRLLIEDPTKGHYATDEGNGVLLDETYIGGVLTSVFRVQSRILENRYVLRGDTLTQELTWWDEKPTRTVKGEGANSEGGVAITSYRVQGMQRAVFTRQKR